MLKIRGKNEIWSSRKKNDSPDVLPVKLKNQGYIYIKGVKEFLKLKPNDPDEAFPPNPTELKTTYPVLYNKLLELLMFTLNEICQVKAPTDGGPYFEEKLIETVRQYSKRDSSVSLIHYFGNDYNDFQSDNKKKEDIENTEEFHIEGIKYPSGTHTDTGIMTLITCAEVSGLQVWDRKTEKFLEVEKMFDPIADMFLIVGRKMNLFARKDKLFEPTTHRVALPAGTERSSLLFFMDVK